jgi:hypothetical protein
MFSTFHYLQLIKLDQMSAYIRRSDAGQRGVGATKQTGYDSLPGCFITVCMFYLPVRFAPSYWQGEREREKCFMTQSVSKTTGQYRQGQLNEMWVSRIGGMILTGETRSTWRKACARATLSTTNLTRTGLRSDLATAVTSLKGFLLKQGVT